MILYIPVINLLKLNLIVEYKNQSKLVDFFRNKSLPKKIFAK